MAILGPEVAGAAGDRIEMASAPIQKSYLTAEEYLALERQAVTKSEYIHGEMVAMTGGTSRHSLVTANLIGLLWHHLRQTSCQVHSGDLRVWIPAASVYYYPDLSVVCGEPLFQDGHRDNLLNPILIVEVLSPSTESYDRGGKFQSYQTIPSLREYVLVSQDQPRVEHFLRQDGHVWLYTDVSGPDGTVSLTSIGCQVPLAEIYDKVEFP
jgi:Uma2 family endonuclease